jgi:ubiquinone/menaquinone biosynthesis C-methylase UbiE
MIRSCPLCSSAQQVVLYHQKFAEFTVIPEYDVVACSDCGMTFASPVPGQLELELYYRKMSKYTDHHSQDEARLRSYVTRFEHEGVPKDAAILDLGCGDGRLCELMREAGWKSVTGATDIDATGGGWDFIILAHVLEHVRDVREFLRKLYDKLTPTGMLWIEVPDPTVLNDAPFQQFSTEHINYFSQLTLNYAVQTAGFAVLWVDYCNDAFSVTVTRGAGRDLTSQFKLKAYIEKSYVRELEIANTLMELPHTYVVWGTGTLALHLLATGLMLTEEIAGFVDSNPNYQGKVIEGVEVMTPEWLRGVAYPILVASVGRKDEIVAQIKAMELPNEVITL